MTEIQNSVSAGDSQQTLCLTLNRSSQQGRINGQSSKKGNLRDQKFTMLKDPPYFCKKFGAALLKFTNGNFDSVTFLKLLCNSWRCPNCAPIKARIAANLIRGVIIINKMKYFLTLTLDPKIIPEKYGDRTQKYITDLFNTLRTNISRMVKGGDIFKYVWVIEFQKLHTNNAHLHIAINTRLDIVEVRKIWQRIGGGPQMYVDEIKDLLSVSGYLSKYLVKNVTDDSINNLYHFEKRYGISQSCIRPKKSTEQFYPDLSNFEKQNVLKSKNIDWVYNMLIKDLYIDGEKILAPIQPL